MVSLVGLQGELLRGLELLLLQLLDLPGEHSLGGDGGVDAGRLDGDDEVAARLKEVLGVEGDDTRLIGLGHVGEDGVHHADEHAVPGGVAGILDDWDDVGALLRHVDEIAAGAVGELHGVHEALRSDDVGAMGHGGTRGGAEVEELGAGLDVDVVEAAQDTGGNLGAERVPHPVLGLGSVFAIDRDALLAVHRLADDHVLGHEGVLLAARHEDALVAVLLHDNLGAALHAAATAASAATAAASTTPATAATAAATTAATAAATAGETACCNEDGGKASTLRWGKLAVLARRTCVKC